MGRKAVDNCRRIGEVKVAMVTSFSFFSFRTKLNTVSSVRRTSTRHSVRYIIIVPGTLG